MNAQQLQNLKELRALGARILAEPERYPLGFGEWSCGTHLCLAGWYAREQLMSVVDVDFGAHELFGVCRWEIFATTSGPADEPGPAAYTELERRLAILDDIIAQHEPQPKGIPSSVRAIFDVETA